MEHTESWHTLVHDFVRVLLHETTVMLGRFSFLIAYCSFQCEEYIYYVFCLFLKKKKKKKAPCFTKIDVIKSWQVLAKQVDILSVFMIVPLFENIERKIL